jgi:hypothetical protein
MWVEGVQMPVAPATLSTIHDHVRLATQAAKADLAKSAPVLKALAKANAAATKNGLVDQVDAPVAARPLSGLSAVAAQLIRQIHGEVFPSESDLAALPETLDGMNELAARYLVEDETYYRGIHPDIADAMGVADAAIALRGYGARRLLEQLQTVKQTPLWEHFENENVPGQIPQLEALKAAAEPLAEKLRGLVEDRLTLREVFPELELDSHGGKDQGAMTLSEFFLEQRDVWGRQAYQTEALNDVLAGVGKGALSLHEIDQSFSYTSSVGRVSKAIQAAARVLDPRLVTDSTTL